MLVICTMDLVSQISPKMMFCSLEDAGFLAVARFKRISPVCKTKIAAEWFALNR